ncbi:MAG: glycosyltransferase [Oceanicaulis sp.]|nr:glycosyltransferase [Oceanicaulis sp.]
MKILLWANGGSSINRYWGTGRNAYKLYSKNIDKSIEIVQAHGINKLDVDKQIFKNEIFISNYESKSMYSRFMFLYRSNKWIKDNYRNYDVFHGLGAFEATFTAAYKFSKLGKPAFIHLTGDQAAFLNNSKISRLLGLPQRRIRRANEITGYIANSKAMVEMLKNVGVDDERIHNIPNHVDVSLFNQVNETEKKVIREELHIPNRFTVILVGGLSYRKRTIELARACGNLIQRGLNMNLLLVGPDRESGKVKNCILKYCNEFNLGNHIKLVDYVSNPLKYYQASDLFVLASKHEGMSGALIEAMAVGLPSIVTKISGSEDLIKSGENGLFTDGSTQDIEKQILVFYNDQKFRIRAGNIARQYIVDNCSTEVVLKQHLKLFNQHM